LSSYQRSGPPLDREDAAAFLTAVDRGLIDADEGRIVSHEEVRRWLLS